MPPSSATVTMTFMTLRTIDILFVVVGGGVGIIVIIIIIIIIIIITLQNQWGK